MNFTKEQSVIHNGKEIKAIVIYKQCKQSIFRMFTTINNVDYEINDARMTVEVKDVSFCKIR